VEGGQARFGGVHQRFELLLGQVAFVLGGVVLQHAEPAAAHAGAEAAQAHAQPAGAALRVDHGAFGQGLAAKAGRCPAQQLLHGGRGLVHAARLAQAQGLEGRIAAQDEAAVVGQQQGVGAEVEPGGQLGLGVGGLRAGVALGADVGPEVQMPQRAVAQQGGQHMAATAQGQGRCGRCGTAHFQRMGAGAQPVFEDAAGGLAQAHPAFARIVAQPVACGWVDAQQRQIGPEREHRVRDQFKQVCLHGPSDQGAGKRVRAATPAHSIWLALYSARRMAALSSPAASIRLSQLLRMSNRLPASMACTSSR
jgi:hypothetical protein